MRPKGKDISRIQGCRNNNAVQVFREQGQDHVTQGHMILGKGKEIVSRKQ